MENTINEFKLQEKVELTVTENASNICKVLSVLKKKILTNDENEVEEIVGIPYNDETLFQDTDEDKLDVEGVLRKKSVEKMACFAHFLQLVIKDRFR